MVCILLTARHRTAGRKWTTEHRYWKQSDWSQVLFTGESRFSLECNIRRVLVWRESGTRNNTIFVQEDEILRPHAIPCATAIGDFLLLMQDKAKPHSPCLVKNFLEAEAIQCIELPPCCPYVNPIKHVWDILGRVAARSRPPVTVQVLEIPLSKEWNSIPRSLIDDHIASMLNRCTVVLAA
ncbi:transposable element Tcb2 transposase [Trichonephila clavipes]|nr:transposable element Tcb2 transposase [Trichonephila clavipes]